MSDIDRREMIKRGSVLGAGVALFNLQQKSPAQSGEEQELLRIGFVGVGARGSNLLKVLLEIEAVQIKSLCDIRADRVARAQRWVTDAGQAEPSAYTRGEFDFQRMCETEELDLVITATPWRWHSPAARSRYPRRWSNRDAGCHRHGARMPPVGR